VFYDDIPDPAGQPQMSEEHYARRMNEMVQESAPSRFAIVQDYGDRVDGTVAAYGLATKKNASIVTDGVIWKLQSAESGARRFEHPPHVTARVVWLDPKPEPDLDDIDDLDFDVDTD
jgi:hypothetical protein